MALEKATIQRYNPDSSTPEGQPIQVLFNPTEYRIGKSNQFAEVAIPGLESPPIQFVRGNVRTLSMQLFFDTYEQGQDVRDYVRQIVDLLEIDPELHAPPICLFSWGDLNFVGVLERADQSFKLFLSDGTPVRATVDVAFKEYFAGQPGDRHSADVTKRYVVRRGDTLSGIAGRKYGDPGLWRPIARENGLDDPLALQPGQILVIPAVE
jgi:nucleoid-associated protein YgaU